MIDCVHIDSDCSLKEHTDLSLMMFPPFEIPQTAFNWALNQFPDGLSFWGWKCIPYFFEIEQGNFNISDSNFKNCLIEHDFEIIRRLFFPQMPSRLQCVFASASLDDLFKNWPTLFKRGASFYEVSCDTSYSMDAAFLKLYSALTGYRLCDNTPGIENIYKYWRCEKSPSPQIELLLPLKIGVHIGNNLTIRG